MMKTRRMTDSGGPPNNGFMEPADPSGHNIAGGGNREVSDMQRTNALSDFVQWGVDNQIEFSSNPDSINDILDQYVSNPELQGTDPEWFEQFLAQYGDHAASAIGALSPIPAGGTIGDIIASYFMSNYWDTHQWANQADTDAFPEGDDWIAELGIDSDLNQSIVEGQSPAGEPQYSQTFGIPYFGDSGGPWYMGNDGNPVFDRSGQAPSHGPNMPYYGPMPDGGVWVDGETPGSGFICWGTQCYAATKSE
jgi:hypothetical protein